MTEYNNDWDISYDPDKRRDVIVIDLGDAVVYLCKSDLLEMLNSLDDIGDTDG